MSRLQTIVTMGLREYRRTPTLVGLLVVLPAYFITVFAWLIPSQPVQIIVPGTGPLAVPTQNAIAALMAPMATALISGVAGLFLVQSAQDVDRRLVVVGWQLPTLFLARGAIMVIAVFLAAGISTGVLATVFIPEQLGWFVLATVLVGILYGAIGALVGLVFNRLAGVYVLLFGPLLDVFLAQNPLTADPHPVAPYLPGHYPMELAVEAAFSGHAIETPWWWAVGYAGVLAGICAVAFYRTIISS